MSEDEDREERQDALARAIALWRARPDFHPTRFSPCHDCRRDGCDAVAIPYAVERASDAIFVCIFPPAGMKSALDQLTPLYGCPTTRSVHPCGPDACEYGRDQRVCPLSGMDLGVERRYGYWTPYLNENGFSKTWKLDVRNRAARVGALDICARMGVKDESLEREIESAPDMLVVARRRSRISRKSDAFDIAFAMCAILFSNARFADALRQNRARAANRCAQAMRVAQRLHLQRDVISAEAIAKVMSPPQDSLPVLLVDAGTRVELAARYAHKCVALWHILYTHVDEHIREMSFRDFCIAALGLFANGHSVINARSGLEHVFARKDMLLKAFAINEWVERKVYSDVATQKISGITGRAIARLTRIVNGCISARSINPAYLNYEEVGYQDIGEEAFRRFKR